MTSLSASDIAARRIREERRRRGWRVTDLAARCKKAGAVKLTAAVITNLETRRRPGREITAEELLALAWVLGVPPVHLLSPLDGTEKLRVVPGEELDALGAPAWLAGDDAVLGAVQMAARSQPEYTERALRSRDDPLTVIRQVRAVARRIGYGDRMLTDEKLRETRYVTDATDAREEAAIRVLGVRLLHLVASLGALGYSRPPLDEVTAILARHGIPATLAEWQQQDMTEGEDPGEPSPRPLV
jgi:transcriptional regulator with XRE-family HTH domain